MESPDKEAQASHRVTPLGVGGGDVWMLALALLVVIVASPAWALAFSAATGVCVLAAAVAVARHQAAGPQTSPKAARARYRLSVGVLVCLGLMSALMASLVPPLQSPDEDSHLRRAYSLQEGVFFISPNSRSAPQNQRVDVGLERFTMAWLNHLATKPHNRATPALEALSRQQDWTGDQSEMFSAGAAYFPVLYWPAAAGLALAQAMDQPVWVANAWARVSMLLVSLLAIALALAIARAGFHVVCATALLPMTWAQFGSVNLDSMTISLGILAAAMMSAGVYGSRTPLGRDYSSGVRAGAWTLLGLLVVSKPLFLALLLPPLAWSLRPHARWNLLPIGLILVVLAAWMVHMAQSFVDVRLQPGASAFARLWEALISPVDTLQLLCSTLAHHHVFYWKTMVGVLGWLDTPLPDAIYVYAAVLLGVAVLADSATPNAAHWQDRSAYAAAAVGYVLATLLILWAAWTPEGAQVIEGVQGRYFLPILPLAALAVGWGHRRGAAMVNVFGIVAAAYVLLVMMELPRVLLYRYWL